MKISIPQQFGPSDVTTWLHQWVPHQDLEDLVIEISENAYCGPGGIAILASCLRYRQMKGLRSRLVWPKTGRLIQYLQRIDFFAHLGIEIKEDFQRHPENNRFVPLQAIETEKTAESVAQSIVDCLEVHDPEMGSSRRNFSKFILSELGCNIVQHANSNGTGYGMGQFFPSAKLTEFAFSDYGVGVLNSLQRNPEFATSVSTDEEAIRLAITEGISSNPNQRVNGGYGLSELDKLCAKFRGQLWIASGEALLYKKYRKTGLEQDRTIQIPNFQGTWVCFKIPA
jgi:hypothetical protein